MTSHTQGSPLPFDQSGNGPAILFLHDDPASHATLLADCMPLAASKLRVVVALVATAEPGGAQVLALLKQLGIGRAVVVAIGRANHTLIELLEKHPRRIAAASFVADRALALELQRSTGNPQIHALLHSGRQPSIATAVASVHRPASAYGAVRAWAARIVCNVRTGLRNCPAILAGLELPGLIQLDEDGANEQVAGDAV